MKVKVFFSAVFVAVFYWGAANGQITPTTQRISLSSSDKAILDQHISHYTAFTIDKKELTDYLKGNGGHEPSFDVRLYDGQGHLIRQTATKGDDVRFNVSNLHNGIYYLHVYDGVSEKPEMQQIIVEQ